MHIVYRLREDGRSIALAQQVTLYSAEGLKPTHGLLGSDQWWENIAVGILPMHTLLGTISRVYMTGHNDFPEFEVLSDAGELSSWVRESSSPELDDMYRVGRRVEIDYVIQQSRPSRIPDVPDDLERKIVLEVRIEDG
jgi:hypothetical protein